MTHTANHPPVRSRLSTPPVPPRESWARRHPYKAAIGSVAGVLAATALANHLLAKRAERRSPPRGRFIHVDGVRQAIFRSRLRLVPGAGHMVHQTDTQTVLEAIDEVATLFEGRQRPAP